MPSTGIVRRLDDLGRIVIPRETRHLLGLRDHDPVEILLGDRALALRKFTPGCVFCGSDLAGVTFRGKNVCRRCLADARRSR